MEEKYHSGFIKLVLCLGDALLIYLALLTSSYFNLIHLNDSQFISFYLIFALTWITIGLFTKIYEISKYSLFRAISVNLFGNMIIHLLLILIMLHALHAFNITNAGLIISYSLTSILFVLSRVLYKVLWKYIEFSGFDLHKVVIVGTTHSGKALHNFFMTHDPSGYLFRGFFDDYPNPEIINRKLVKGTIDDLKEYCIREDIDEIYFTLPLSHKDLLDRLTKFADDNCIYFKIVPEFSEAVKSSYNVYLYDSIPVLTSRKEPLGISLNAGVKRLFDIGFSVLVILFIFPFIIPLIAVAIKLDSSGPLLFKQLRPGKRNKLFECYKFRTMRVNDSTETMATKNDSRITKVGAFLRKTSLDELPQFFNVLLGDMSVVGPRPNLISQLEEYSKTLKKYKVRHFVPPGITGYAQVNGCRGEIKQKEYMEKRVEYDVAYMENWSLMLDLKIILQTVKKMVTGDKHAY